MSPRLRVLLVEDSPDDAELVAHELRRGGFDPVCHRVDTAEAMAAALRDAEWDVVISDHSMPQFSSTAALALLKETGLDVPFIMVSGTMGEDVAVAAMKDGAHDYLIKGSLARLVPAVERELKEAQSRARRREAEAELQAQRDFLNLVIDTAPALIFAKDRDGRYTLVNQRMANLYGTTVEKLIGRRDADFNQNPAEVEQFLHDDREVMDTLRPKYIAAEPATDARTGEIRWFETWKIPLLSPPGPQVLGASIDITERKRAEEALRATETQLQQAQKMEAIGRLAGGIAHDFNNLLTAIIGYSDLVLAALDAKDPNRPDIEEIKRAGDRAAALTRQLLAFSRHQVLEPKVIDVNEVVRGVENMLRRLIGEDVQLRTALAPELGCVKADQGQLSQVIMNLAVNARDAMPEGGSLLIGTANVDLDDEYARCHVGARTGPHVMLAVSDTGCGMDAATQARVFEPFFTTKDAGKGTGLGLSTVYGIVKQSGGNIWLYSEVGRGTTFKVYLPRVDEIETVEAPAVVREHRGSETILAVEDDRTILDLVHKVLNQAGYVVLDAHDTGEAAEIAAAVERPIDLLITDVVLPGESGPELAARLHASRPGLKVLYLSGYTDRAVVDHNVLSRGMAFLQKPFTGAALAAKVRYILDGPSPIDA